MRLIKFTIQISYLGFQFINFFKKYLKPLKKTPITVLNQDSWGDYWILTINYSTIVSIFFNIIIDILIFFTIILLYIIKLTKILYLYQLFRRVETFLLFGRLRKVEQVA